MPSTWVLVIPLITTFFSIGQSFWHNCCVLGWLLLIGSPRKVDRPFHLFPSHHPLYWDHCANHQAKVTKYSNQSSQAHQAQRITFQYWVGKAISCSFDVKEPTVAHYGNPWFCKRMWWIQVVRLIFFIIASSVRRVTEIQINPENFTGLLVLS